jgi:hypothetical protein
MDFRRIREFVERRGSILRGAILSLLRQWLIRSEVWKWLVAGIAGVVPLLIAFGVSCRGTDRCTPNPRGAPGLIV